MGIGKNEESDSEHSSHSIALYFALLSSPIGRIAVKRKDSAAVEKLSDMNRRRGDQQQNGDKKRGGTRRERGYDQKE